MRKRLLINIFLILFTYFCAGFQGYVLDVYGVHDNSSDGLRRFQDKLNGCNK